MAAIRRATNPMSGIVMALCALASALAGCSTVQGIAGVPRAGYQDNGTYVLSAQEQAEGCRDLQERSIGLQEHMHQLSLRAMEQMQEVPNTMVAAWKRLVGSPGDGVPAVAEYNQARAESAALNTTIAAKGCAPVTTASIKR